MNILIVDDDLTSLKLLRAQMESEGHTVFEAHDGVDALALLERQRVDAVISDVLMPRLDGYRLCHEIRKHTQLYDLPVIIYTSTYTSPGDEKLALDVGANKYLKKPTSVETIIAALHEVIAVPHAVRHSKALQEVNVPKEYSEKLVSKLKEKNTELQAQTEALRLPNAAMTAAANAIVITDRDGSIVWANPAFSTLTDYTLAEAAGKNPRDLVKSGQQERAVYEEMWATILAGVVWHGQIVNRRKDGSLYPEEQTITPVRDANGEITHFIAIKQDLSERKKTEQELMAAEVKFRSLVEQSIVGIYIVQDDQIVYVNPMVTEIFGWSEEEVTSRTVYDFIVPEDHALVRENMRNRISGAGASDHYHLRMLHRSGAVLQIEVHASWTDHNGRPAILGALLDITERKAAEIRLVQMEARYRGLLEAAPDAMVVVNQSGNIALLNVQAERQFGYHRDELIGQKVTTIVPEGFAERLIVDGSRSAAEALAQQIGMGIELTGRRKNGSEFPIELMLSPLDSGEGILVTAAIRDISARHIFDEQLRQSQKMEAIGNLTGGMAHDFNNMLGVVIGNLDLLRPLLAPGSMPLELLEESLAAALRGAELTRRLLAFARRQPLAPQRVVLNDLVSNIVQLLKRTLGEQVVIELDLTSSVWPVVVDATQFEAMITNLATNARDAMPKGGRLTIATANRRLDEDYTKLHPDVAAGDYVVTRLTDTGTGMTQDVMARIFDPFYTTKELGTGTGLGLSMVFGFMKQSGGHIAVYSEPGIGSTFRLYLPRLLGGVVEQEPPRKTEMARAGGETVLAVEDNAALRRVVVRQLTELGYQVREAGNIADALEMMKNEKVDLLFSDVVMPGTLDGHALAREVAALWPSTKVLLTSGFPVTRGNGTSTAPAPARQLLSKPYRRDELARALREALDM